MSNKENMSEEIKSHSSIKREERKKEVAKARRNSKAIKAAGYCIIAVIVGLAAWGIASLINTQLSKVQQTDNYSAGLDENGYISGVKASDKVTLPEYKGITVPYSEIEYTDDEIDADIASLVAGYESVSEDESLVVADGDTVNIAYVGTIDGVAFEGGTSDSYDLTIGSGTFIEGFESQLIGAQNLSSVEVNVTFPEDYGNEELSGKAAVFAVDIKGIYTVPEFDDSFVAENLSDYASTAEEYRQYLKETNEDTNLTSWIDTYLNDNTTVKSYSNKYLGYLKSIQKYDDMQTYQYMNQMYESYLGYSYYSSFEDYAGMSEAEYDISLKDTAKETAKRNMIYQAIVELEGATADAEYYKAYLAEQGYDETYYDSQVATAGEPYILQLAIRQKALEIVKENAVIEK